VVADAGDPIGGEPAINTNGMSEWRQPGVALPTPGSPILPGQAQRTTSDPTPDRLL